MEDAVLVFLLCHVHFLFLLHVLHSRTSSALLSLDPHTHPPIDGMKVADEDTAISAAAAKDTVTAQPGSGSPLKLVGGGEYFSAATSNVTAGMSLGYSTTLKYGTHVAGKTLEAGNFSAHVMGDASTFIASATIGKENTEYINRLALNATGLAFDATGMATGLALGAGAMGVGALATSFNAGAELGRGAIARAFKGTEVDALALRLLKGHTVFSRNYYSDLWLHLKNKQIFLSLFFVHPKHPFSKSERISALTVSCLLAWSLEWWFCLLWTSCNDHSNENFISVFINVLLLKIAVSATCNGLYDAALEQAMTCACVQEGCPGYVKAGCEWLSLVQLLIQTGAGVLLGMAGVVLLWQSGRGNQDMDNMKDYLFVTIKELVIGKLMGLFVVTMLVECLGFHTGRSAQLKPAPPPPEEPNAPPNPLDLREYDPKAREAWSTPSKAFCGGKGSPPSMLWDRFIGEKAEFADLPDWAPTYDVDVYFFWKLAYSERADTPSHIPKWFLDEAFIDDQDNDFSNATSSASTSSGSGSATSAPAVSNQSGKKSRRGSLARRKILQIPTMDSVESGTAPSTQSSQPTAPKGEDTSSSSSGNNYSSSSSSVAKAEVEMGEVKEEPIAPTTSKPNETDASDSDPEVRKTAE